MQDGKEVKVEEEVTKETCPHNYEDWMIYGDDARDMMCTKCGTRFWDCRL